MYFPPPAAGPPCRPAQLWGLQGDPGVPPDLRCHDLHLSVSSWQPFLAKGAAGREQRLSVLPTVTRLSSGSGDQVVSAKLGSC